MSEKDIGLWAIYPYDAHLFLFIYLWLQFLSKNSPCLGVKVLAYEYTEYITEIFEDWTTKIEYELMHLKI